MVRVGAPWRDLRESFGKWNSVFQRFCCAALRVVAGPKAPSSIRFLKPCHKTLILSTSSSIEPSSGCISTVPAQGGTSTQAIGRSRGGLTTKIVALVDGLGHLVGFILLPGQCHDSVGVARLLTDRDFAALLADQAFDSNVLGAELADRGAVAVIPPKANRATSIAYDAERYKWRHLVENFLYKLKDFRRIATRYDKTDESFKAMIHLVDLVGTVLETRSMSTVPRVDPAGQLDFGRRDPILGFVGLHD